MISSKLSIPFSHTKALTIDSPTNFPGPPEADGDESKDDEDEKREEEDEGIDEWDDEDDEGDKCDEDEDEMGEMAP